MPQYQQLQQVAYQQGNQPLLLAACVRWQPAPADWPLVEWREWVMHQL
jgi:hypothetical protein